MGKKNKIELDYHLPTFKKGDTVYALVGSTYLPNFLLLCKAKIIDYQHGDKNPLYRIKFQRFYSSFIYVKRFFKNSKFVKNIDASRNYPWILDPYEFDNKEEFENELKADTKGKHYIWVEGLMLFQKKWEAKTVLNEIMDTAIELRFRELEFLCTYTEYKGKFSIPTLSEFWNWIYNKFPKFEKFDKMEKKEFEKIR